MEERSFPGCCSFLFRDLTFLMAFQAGVEAFQFSWGGVAKAKRC